MQKRKRTEYVPRKDRVKRPKTKAPARSKALTRQGEIKGMDTLLTIAGPILNTTGTNGDCFVLNLVGPGTGSWNRIGRKLYPKSLRLRGCVVYQYAAQTTTSNLLENYVRMVVVWDNQPSGAAIPTFADVFGYTPQDGNENSTVLAPPRYDNMDRFHVLRDCVMPCDVQTHPATGGSTNIVFTRIPFDEYIKMKNLTTVFGGNSAAPTIADISTGAIYVYFRASQATATTAAASIESTSLARLRYTD